MNNNNSMLAFILGAVVVAVAVLGYAYYNGGLPGQKSEASITIEVPKP